MKSIELLIDKLYELYDVYEKYIWKNDNTYLVIVLEDQSIRYVLYNTKEIIDTLEMEFDEECKSLCKYIGLRYFIKLFGNVVIHHGEDECERLIFNDKHLPYLKMIVSSDELFDAVKEIIDIQYDTFVNEDLPMVKDFERKLTRNRDCRKLNKIIEQRIDLTRSIFRGMKE